MGRAVFDLADIFIGIPHRKPELNVGRELARRQGLFIVSELRSSDAAPRVNAREAVRFSLCEVSIVFIGRRLLVVGRRGMSFYEWLVLVRALLVMASPGSDFYGARRHERRHAGIRERDGNGRSEGAAAAPARRQRSGPARSARFRSVRCCVCINVGERASSSRARVTGPRPRRGDPISGSPLYGVRAARCDARTAGTSTAARRLRERATRITSCACRSLRGL